ncbi:MAG: ABC transporter ATP-binding protein [Saprospiraceae bacterium]|uniref:ABC transporter ATP-binding protein n=1 Tax=Candidatus Defluviibacterium haderslevense TaxID=2981993 RepID=A0A9D7SA16_9BACT|nr:ABC transporter ATP-binding protein [Candidatus Defluviibacterium haderslevense]
MKHLFTLNQYIFKYKNKLILGILFISLSNIFRILQPQAIRKALDEILLFIKQNPELRDSHLLSYSLMKFGLMVLGFALLMGLFMFFMRQTIIVMSRLIEYDLRSDLFNHYLILDTRFYKSNKIGDLMSRISEDVNKVRMYLGPAVLYGINLISLFIIVIITMFNVNFWLSVYCLLPLPFLSFIIYKVSNTINKRSEKIQKQLSRLTSLSQETFSGIRIIKSFNRENNWIHHFTNESSKQKEYSLSLNKIDALFFPSMFLLIGLSTLITIYIGGLNVFEGSVTPGNIAEFVMYITMLTWPVSAIGWCASIIQQAEASQKRINEFLSLLPDINDSKSIQSLIPTLDIEFKDLNFTYPENQVQALHHLNVFIPEGEHVAIVGHTGSGKSTIAELLLRMYDPTSGSISIGNIELDQLKISSLRNNIAYVPQDVFLFSDSILENILLGAKHKDLPLDEIENFCKMACIHDEIIKFPNGYATQIGERGVSLSGGQKQRLSIARALIKSAKIVILDNCLSAVDTETEVKILKNLELYCKGKTLMLITHRLNQCKNMDRIIVLKDGQIAEIGNFEALIREQGIFYNLLMLENSTKNIPENEILTTFTI